MPKILGKCTNCNEYALKIAEKKCIHCGHELRSPHPPKFSPDSHYAGYLRKMKEVSQNQK